MGGKPRDQLTPDEHVVIAIRKTALKDWFQRITQEEADALREWVLFVSQSTWRLSL